MLAELVHAKKPRTPEPAPPMERVATACPAVGSVAVFRIVTTRDRAVPGTLPTRTTTASMVTFEVAFRDGERVHRVTYGAGEMLDEPESPLERAIFLAAEGLTMAPLDIVTGDAPRVVDPGPLVAYTRQMLERARPAMRPLLGPEPDAAWEKVVAQATDPALLSAAAVDELMPAGLLSCARPWLAEFPYERQVSSPWGVPVPVTGTFRTERAGDALHFRDEMRSDPSAAAVAYMGRLAPEMQAAFAQHLAANPVDVRSSLDLTLAPDGWPLRWRSEEHAGTDLAGKATVMEGTRQGVPTQGAPAPTP